MKQRLRARFPRGSGQVHIMELFCSLCVASGLAYPALLLLPSPSLFERLNNCSAAAPVGRVRCLSMGHETIQDRARQRNSRRIARRKP